MASLFPDRCYCRNGSSEMLELWKVAGWISAEGGLTKYLLNLPVTYFSKPIVA